MASKFLDYESVDKGTPLDGISIPALTRAALARFAGAVDDYNPMHLDDKVATAAGKSSVFAPSTLIMGYIGRMVETCFQGASLRRYGLRILKLVWPGDVLTCRGVVIDKRKEGNEYVLDADVWADNQRGETVAKGRVLAVIAGPGKKKLSRTEAGTGVVYQPGGGSARSATTKKAGTKSKAASKKATKKTTKKAATKKKPAKKK